MKKIIKKSYKFLLYNKNKYLYVKILFLSAFYRLSMFLIPIEHRKRHMGVMNEESSGDVSEEYNQFIRRISRAVDFICNHTPWESKCLVRALTIQNLLKKKRISSTLYLGVGNKKDNMTAHAWIRSGKYYLSGGNGDGYAVVAKFRA